MSIPKILLYYVFAPVADPEAVRLWQRELCESLGLRGRIIISKHGINGTVGGELDACKQYVKRTREYAPFKALEHTVKWSDGTGFVPHEPKIQRNIDRSVPWKQIVDFPRLSVKVRDELVGFGSPEEIKVGMEGVLNGGVHLSPEEVNKLVAERDDVVFFDGRNAFEAAVGRFKGAVVPKVATSHDFIEALESGEYDDLKNRPVITYCTGGIRCEILSAVMKNRGFNEVYQIDGGIVRYGEKFGNGGLWEGSLVVFDGREEMEFGEGTAVLGECAVCGKPSSRLENCTDLSCRNRFVVCEEHSGQRCRVHGGTIDASPAAMVAAIEAQG